MISFDSFVAQDGVPIYLQIVKHIKSGIVSGTVVSGDEVPSRRVLSALLGVNPNTIQKAYAELERQGIIQSVAGKGSIIVVNAEAVNSMQSGHISEKIRQMAKAALEAGFDFEMFCDVAKDVFADGGDKE